MQALRDDAELRRKQEIHEAEESKNAHIQDLMKKHEKVNLCSTPLKWSVNKPPSSTHLHKDEYTGACWRLSGDVGSWGAEPGAYDPQ